MAFKKYVRKALGGHRIDHCDECGAKIEINQIYFSCGSGRKVKGHICQSCHDRKFI